MPYSSNAELPEYVKKLSEDKQTQWRKVFNTCLKSGKSEGDCFRMASGVVRKSGVGEDFEGEGDAIDYIDDIIALAFPVDESAIPAETPVTGALPTETVLDTDKSSGVKALVGRLFGGSKTARREGLLVVKQADGRMRWFARYSNAWEDRDREILTEASHKEYVDWAYKNNTFPELWLWHTKGTRFGSADWLDFSHGFAHASGLIDVGREPVAYKLAKMSGIGMSHGFVSAQTGKYITAHRTFEISVLPLSRAAVWATDFNLVQAADRKDYETMFGERRGFLVEVLGEEAVKGLEASSESMAKALTDAKVDYKEAGEDKSAALVSEIEGVKEALVSVVGALQIAQKDIIELKKTRDESLEDAFASKVAKALANGGVVRPTESTQNVVAEKDAPPQVDFFSAMIAKQIGGATAAAGAAGVGKVTVG